VLEEFQVLGYPIISSARFQGRSGCIASSSRTFKAGASRPLEVSKWPENYSANSVQKVGGEVCGRHPNVVVLDLSSFKCGHDRPNYGLNRFDHLVVGDAVSALARHRRQQAGRVDQDRVKTYAHLASCTKSAR